MIPKPKEIGFIGILPVETCFKNLWYGISYNLNNNLHPNVVCEFQPIPMVTILSTTFSLNDGLM